MAGDRSDEQNDGIVADDFAILANDRRAAYSKAEHNPQKTTLLKFLY
jgi:hypothetical protein